MAEAVDEVALSIRWLAGNPQEHILCDADRDDMLVLPVACGHVRHAQGKFLFDMSCHPSVAENVEARWSGLTKFLRPTMNANDNV